MVPPARFAVGLTPATSAEAYLVRPPAPAHHVPDQADQHVLDRVPVARVAQHDRYPGAQAERDPDVIRLEPGSAVEAVDRDDERHPVVLEVVDRGEAVGD